MAARVYANEAIEVTWEPKFCVHAAECLERSPRVFEPMRRPWIKVDYDEPDHLAQVIERCPTGALHFRRLDGGAQEKPLEKTEVEAVANGPLLLRGNLKIIGPDGNPIREDTRVALCRCGSSANKPFCDGTHRLIGFETRA